MTYDCCLVLRGLVYCAVSVRYHLLHAVFIWHGWNKLFLQNFAIKVSTWRRKTVNGKLFTKQADLHLTKSSMYCMLISDVTYKDESVDSRFVICPELWSLIQLIKLMDPLQHHLLLFLLDGEDPLPNTRWSFTTITDLMNIKMLVHFGIIWRFGGILTMQCYMEEEHIEITVSSPLTEWLSLPVLLCF